MTDLGKHYLDSLIRVRAFASVTVALGVAAVQYVLPTYPLQAILYLLLLEVGASLLMRALVTRVQAARLVHASLWFDTAIITLAIFYTGGVDGGLASLYIWNLIIAALLLGLRWIPFYALLSLSGFAIELGIEAAGVYAPGARPQPLIVAGVSQLVIVLSLSSAVYILTRAIYGMTQRLQGEKIQLIAGRNQAERARARWELINRVALRIQESTTPPQVFATIGEELERLKLHCIIFQWDEPDVSMKAVYRSLAPPLRQLVRESLQYDPENLRFRLDEYEDMRHAIEKRAPCLVENPLTGAAPVSPQVPLSTIKRVLQRAEVNAFIYAPMIVGERVTGILGVWGNQLDQDDLPPLAALAEQAASALDKATLLAQVQKRAAQLELVSLISARAAAIHDAQELMDQVVKMIGERFGYHIVGIMLLDPRQNDLYVTAAYGRLAERVGLPYRQALDVGIVGKVAREGKTYLARDVRNDPYYVFPLDHDQRMHACTVRSAGAPARLLARTSRRRRHRGTAVPLRVAHPDGGLVLSWTFSGHDDPVRSEITLPLRHHDQIMGVLDLQSTTPDAFDASDVAAMEILADQVSAALEKSRALAAEQKRAAHLALVGEIAARATSTSEADEILQTMVELVAERFGYHHVCAMLLDPAQDALELRAVAGPSSSEYHLGDRTRLDEGLIGLAARTRDVIVSGDVKHDSRYLPGPGGGANSELCVPFLKDDQVIGVLDIESVEYDAYDETDVAAIKTLADQIAVALEKARLLQSEHRRAAQFELVNRVASRTARLLPVDRLLQEAVQDIQAQFGYFNVAILLNIPTQRHLVLKANAGNLNIPQAYQQGYDHGIIGHVAVSGRTYLSAHTETDPFYRPAPLDGGADPIHSELAVPLRRGAQLLGVLDVQSEIPEAFAASDVAALETLADQVATALENARLFENESRRAEELETLRQLALELIAQRELDVLLHSIVERAAQLLRADGGELFTVDPATGEMVCVISYPLPQKSHGARGGARLQIGEGLAGKVVERGEAIFVDNYRASPDRDATFANSRADEPLSAVLGVPLIWQGRVLGVINLRRNENLPRFGAGDLRLANLFAGQAASALENARLLGEVRAQLVSQRALTDLSHALLQTTDLDEILRQAVKSVANAVNTEGVIVFLPDDQHQLYARASVGWDDSALATLRLPADTSSIPGYVLLTHRVSMWSEDDHTPGVRVHPFAMSHGFHAGISLPMLVGDEAVGVITVNSHQPRAFDENEIRTLTLLANQTAIALQRARYLEQVQRSARELNLLFEAHRATTSTLDPGQVISHLLERLALTLDVTSAYYAEVDEAEGTLNLVQMYFAEAAAPQERTVGERAHRLEDYPEIREMLRTGPITVQRTDPAVRPSMREYMQSFGAQSILRVPMRAADQVVGYLALWESRAPRVWRESEIRFTQTMASQAAAALANARLYEHARTRTRELEALYQAGQKLNQSLSVREICDACADALKDILGYDHISIYFVQNDLLQMQVQRGYSSPIHTIELNQGIMARAVLDQQTIYLPDVRTDPGFIAATSDLRSEIAVPLSHGGQVLGVLNVETTAPRALLPADVRLLTTFANQLVIAIENAQLYQDAEQRVTELATLHDSALALSTELDLGAVLQKVVDLSRRLVNAKYGALGVLDAEGKYIEQFITSGITPEQRARLGELPRGHGLLGAVILENRPIRISDISRDSRSSGFPPNHPPMHSLLAVPITSKTRVFGNLYMTDKQVRLAGQSNAPDFAPEYTNFSERDQQLLELFATQAAIAVENARLYEDAQRRLRETQTLYEFATVLGETLEIEELGRRALSALARLADFDVGGVALLDQVTHSLTPVAFGGRESSAHSALSANVFRSVLHEQLLPRGGDAGIANWVATHGEPVRLGNATQDPRYLPVFPNMHSELCVPLRVGDRIIGVITLESEQYDAFDAHVEQLLTTFAHQLAIAFENARLYEQTRRDAEVKAALLRELSHRVKNNLAAITSLLYMALDEPADSREEIISETLGRVQSMALAHTLLAQSEHAQVNLTELGRHVLNDTVRQLAVPGGAVQVSVQGDDVGIAARQTTTLALLLNELATNALRHGFVGDPAAGALHGEGSHPDEGKWLLRLCTIHEGRRATFILENNGKDLPPNFDLQADAGLGLSLVKTLVEKDLHGSIQMRRHGDWTQAIVQFTLEE